MELYLSNLSIILLKIANQMYVPFLISGSNIYYKGIITKILIDLSNKVNKYIIQRRLSVGYGRAAKLIDKMEEMGYVSAPDGQKPRELLITKQEYMEILVKKEDAE